MELKETILFDINEPTNKFFLSDQDIVYVKNKNGEFEKSLDSKTLQPSLIDIMWGGLAKEHVESMLEQARKRFGYEEPN